MDEKGIPSPYWKVPLMEVIRDLDRLMCPNDYANAQHFRDTIYQTAFKNPAEIQLYLESLNARAVFIAQIIKEVNDEKNAKGINTAEDTDA